MSTRLETGTGKFSDLLGWCEAFEEGDMSGYFEFGKMEIVTFAFFLVVEHRVDVQQSKTRLRSSDPVAPWLLDVVETTDKRPFGHFPALPRLLIYLFKFTFSIFDRTGYFVCDSILSRTIETLLFMPRNHHRFNSVFDASCYTHNRVALVLAMPPTSSFAAQTLATEEPSVPLRWMSDWRLHIKFSERERSREGTDRWNMSMRVTGMEFVAQNPECDAGWPVTRITQFW